MACSEMPVISVVDRTPPNTTHYRNTCMWVSGSMRHVIERGSVFTRVLQTCGLCHVSSTFTTIVFHNLVTHFLSSHQGTAIVAESQWHENLCMQRMCTYHSNGYDGPRTYQNHRCMKTVRTCRFRANWQLELFILTLY